MINRSIIIIIFLLSLILFSNNFSRNTEKLKFKKIGIEEGLSQSSILSIYQDSNGFMWFGTASGLNRYDGYEFKVFYNNVDDSTSISDNDISAIFEDSKGNLWVGTASGILNKYDSKTDRFTKYDIAFSSDWYSSDTDVFENYPLSFSRNQKSTITDIKEDSSGSLWIGTWGKGLVRFNPKTYAKRYYYHFRRRSNTLSSNKIVRILVDNQNDIWVGTFGGGLNKAHIEDNFKVDLIFKRILSSELGNNITALYQFDNNQFWIASYNKGLFVLKIDNSEKVTLQSRYGKIKNILDIKNDADNTVWIATFGNGLFSFTDNKFKNYLHDSNDPSSLSDNDIQSLYIDKSGVLWLGTQLSSGINKLEIGFDNFFSLPINTIRNRSLNSTVVWSIYEDNFENVWIGTLDGGINIWNKRTGNFKYFTKDNYLPDNHIRTIKEDKYGNLWIGTFSRGLVHYNSQNKTFTNFINKYPQYRQLNSSQIQALLPDGDNLILGTFGNGLMVLNLKNFYEQNRIELRKFIHDPAEPNSISDNRIYSIIKDSTNVYWVGTHGGGINRVNIEKRIIESYKFGESENKIIADDRITILYKTKDNELLAGTFGGGLNKFNITAKSFQHLNDKIGMNCADVYGIVEDTLNYWISTDNGIFSLKKDYSSFRQYDISDGLQSLEFSGGAYYKNKEGIFYFGGIKGLNYFNPKTIKLDTYTPNTVITQIKVFNKAIKGEPEELVFGMDQNYFSFEFASLDFKNPSKNMYKYMLEGLDKEWTYTDAKNRKVFYNNLSPGNYVFKVVGTNNDGLWSPYQAEAKITILAPFWLRWWFIMGVTLFLITMIAFYIRQRFKYLIALDELKSNIAADLHDNVGAGLTEISILSELVSNEVNANESVRKRLFQISSLSRQMVETMSDIVWVVNPNRSSLYDLIIRLKDSYSDLLFDLGIRLRTPSLDELTNIGLPIDYKQNLYLILKESINNAIKHSACKNIDININISKNKFKIEIIDDGKGFNTDLSFKSNGLNNIKTRGENINGAVSINSTEGKGTAIHIEGKIV